MRVWPGVGCPTPRPGGRHSLDEKGLLERIGEAGGRGEEEKIKDLVYMFEVLEQ